MGKGDITWAVPVVHGPIIAARHESGRRWSRTASTSSYYGVAFPTLCCVCGEAEGTVAHEIGGHSSPSGLISDVAAVFGYTQHREISSEVFWCQKCADDHENLQERESKKWFSKELQKYNEAVVLMGIEKIIRSGEHFLVVRIKNEKYSEAFGRANPRAKCLSLPWSRKRKYATILAWVLIILFIILVTIYAS